jgi:hypothetical protein
MASKGGKKQATLVRSSAAEYLTFVAATGDQSQAVEMRYEDENIWLTQKMIHPLRCVRACHQPASETHLRRPGTGV